MNFSLGSVIAFEFLSILYAAGEMQSNSAEGIMIYMLSRTALVERRRIYTLISRVPHNSYFSFSICYENVSFVCVIILSTPSGFI